MSTTTAKRDEFGRWLPVAVALLVGWLFPVGGLVVALIFAALAWLVPDRPVRWALLAVAVLWAVVLFTRIT